MKKISFFLLMLLLCFIAKAQLSVAIVGGPQTNATTPAFTLLADTIQRSINRQIGINFGLIANAALDKRQSLFFRSGVLYSSRNTQVVQHYDTASIDINQERYLVQATSNLKLNYIDVPVNLLYKLPLGGKTKFVFGGGLQASFLYNGKTDLNTIKGYRAHPDSFARMEYKQEINEDLPIGNTTDKYQTVHFSANALTGFEFGRAILTVHYSNGLNHFFKNEQSSFKHQTIGVHLGVYIGSTKQSRPATNVIKDKDNDGIADNVDMCPDAPGTLLTKGCPDKDGDGISDIEDKCPDVAGTLQQKGCPPPDKDKDGVKDEEDKCPDVAGLAKYGGCPIPDTDKDGVNDEEDKCPTVIGLKDNSGCPKVTKEQQQKVSYAAKRIEFEFKKTDVSPSSFTQLDEIVTILKNNPTLKIRVEGHTSGPIKESNTVLSQQRAESVKAYFVNKGVAESRILAKGFGSSRPISKNGNKTENPIDRRVEMYIY